MLLLLLLSYLSLANSKCFDIDVGQRNTLAFQPETITGAKSGDTVRFHFYPGGHGVAEGMPQKACKPKPNGFWSGFKEQRSGVNPKMFTVTLNSTDPIFIYCPQVTHCQFGMAMVINPPNPQALQNYKDKADKAPTSGVPTKVRGGKLIKNKNCS